MTEQSFDISDTLIPNTDQLVADDLRTGHRDIKIIKVERISDEKRPLAIYFEGDDGKPYLPNVSMRRVIAEAWGTDRRQWAGKWLRLFRNPKIKMGSAEVGGIRISHAYPLAQPELLISLITTRGKRSIYKLAQMEPPTAAAPVPSSSSAAPPDAAPPLEPRASTPPAQLVRRRVAHTNPDNSIQ